MHATLRYVIICLLRAVLKGIKSEASAKNAHTEITKKKQRTKKNIKIVTQTTFTFTIFLSEFFRL